MAWLYFMLVFHAIFQWVSNTEWTSSQSYQLSIQNSVDKAGPNCNNININSSFFKFSVLLFISWIFYILNVSYQEVAHKNENIDWRNNSEISSLRLLWCYYSSWRGQGLSQVEQAVFSTFSNHYLTSDWRYSLALTTIHP